MKTFHLLEEAEKIAVGMGNPQTSQVMSILTLRTLEHYIREHLKVVRQLRAKYGDPFFVQAQADLAIANCNKILEKHGLKEREEEKIESKILL